MSEGPSRRTVLAGAAGLASSFFAPGVRAEPMTLVEAVRAFAGENAIKPGRVTLELPPLVENGNAVPLAVTVESPMTADAFVRRIGVFNEKNPQPNVAVFHLSPIAGRAQVSTRIRLATTQKLVAVAELSDGTFWSGEADVVVTLAACTEDL